MHYSFTYASPRDYTRTQYIPYDDSLYEVIEVGDYVAWVTIFNREDDLVDQPGIEITDPTEIEWLCRKLGLPDFVDRYLDAYVRDAESN